LESLAFEKKNVIACDSFGQLQELQTWNSEKVFSERKIFSVKMLSQIVITDLPEHYYDDFLGIEIYVPCSTWDKEEASKCWGEDFEGKLARGVVTKVAFHRKTKQPKFEIKFPQNKIHKHFRWI
jgi:hypothetical protein